MEGKGFSTSEVIKAGWKAMEENIWFFIGFLLLLGFIQALPYIVLSMSGYDVEHLPSGLNFIVGIIHWILMAVVSMASIRVALDLSVQEKPKWSSIVTGFPLVIKFILAELLYVVVVSIGFILLLAPGIYWGLKYLFFGYFIVDKGVGPMEAFEMSSKLTDGAKWDLLGFVIISWLITLIGMLLFGVGLFAAIPTVLVAKALIYRKLSFATAMANGS